MNWEDEGYLLSKKKFRENAVIISAFTKTHGKISGIVYGGTSRKIKNYLQIGNKIFLIHNSKNRNKLGYLKTEIIEAISPRYFNDKKRSYLILSIADLLNSLFVCVKILFVFSMLACNPPILDILLYSASLKNTLKGLS